jgi:exopolysaccharide production protein ExoQ
MPPRLALLLGYIFAFLLFRNDIRQRKLSSAALWIPGIWLAILSSRPMTFWLGSASTNSQEGSSINVISNGALIFGALFVLMSRRFAWGEFVKRNKVLVLLYVFFVFSAAWSQFPTSTLKRISNDFGCVLAALVILTEKDVAAAVKVLYTRVAFVLIPMSLIVIRYVPSIGRSSSKAGEPMYQGVTFHKNSLGEVVMLFGLVILWDLIQQRENGQGDILTRKNWAKVTTLAIGLYLLFLCDSATALACTVIGIGCLLGLGRLAQHKNGKRLLYSAVVCLPLVWVVDQILDLSGIVYTILGRTRDLTGRTDIWRVVGSQHVNGLIGSGFRAFWESSAGNAANDELGMNRLLTAHNGYLEAYLNGGIIALGMLITLLITTFKRGADRLMNQHPFSTMTIMFWVVTAVFNNTESAFFILGPVWFTFLLFTIDVPLPAADRAVPSISRGVRRPLVSARTS